jgi:hypothetical protein
LNLDKESVSTRVRLPINIQSDPDLMASSGEMVLSNK